jgi:hypothetical protein
MLTHDMRFGLLTRQIQIGDNPELGGRLFRKRDGQRRVNKDGSM